MDIRSIDLDIPPRMAITGTVHTAVDDRFTFDLDIQQWTSFGMGRSAFPVTCIIPESPRFKKRPQPKVGAIVAVFGTLTGFGPPDIDSELPGGAGNRTPEPAGENRFFLSVEDVIFLGRNNALPAMPKKKRLSSCFRLYILLAD